MWEPDVTKGKFEKDYCIERKIDNYDKWYITLPCNCREGSCRGWAAIRKDFIGIIDHMEFSAPSAAGYIKWDLDRRNDGELPCNGTR